MCADCVESNEKGGACCLGYESSRREQGRERERKASKWGEGEERETAEAEGDSLFPLSRFPLNVVISIC